MVLVPNSTDTTISNILNRINHNTLVLRVIISLLIYQYSKYIHKLLFKFEVWLTFVLYIVTSIFRFFFIHRNVVQIPDNIAYNYSHSNSYWDKKWSLEFQVIWIFSSSLEQGTQ